MGSSSRTAGSRSDRRATPSSEASRGRAKQATPHLLELQRAAGNRAVCNLLSQVQPKLTVGAADEPYEREADAVARSVVKAHRDPTAAPLDGKDRMVRRRVNQASQSAAVGTDAGDLDRETEAALASQLGRGRPLGRAARASMESAFGVDFSGVRVHDGGASTELNRRMQANAFTVGQDIFFRSSAPGATSPAGQELLAHELTHVVQQGAAQRTITRSARSGPAEQNKGSDAATATVQRKKVPRPVDPRKAPKQHDKLKKEHEDGNIVKLVFAGSGYGKWATHEAAKYKAETGQEPPTWQSEGLPSPSYWTRVQEGKGKNPTYYQRTHDKGKNVGRRRKTAKTEYLFAGVGGTGTSRPLLTFRGVQDRGSNKIDNVVKCALKLVKELDPQPHVVMIKGHSRGAVAAAFVAQELSRTYKVEVALFDPVPGPTKASKNYKLDMAKFGNVESTVAYSVATQYATGFVPMQVLGAKRLILSTQHHSVGTKYGFVYNNELYTGNRLNQLDAGIYLDKNEYPAGNDLKGKTGTASQAAELEKVGDGTTLEELKAQLEEMRESTGRKTDVNPDDWDTTRRGQLHRVLTKFYNDKK